MFDFLENDKELDEIAEKGYQIIRILDGMEHYKAVALLKSCMDMLGETVVHADEVFQDRPTIPDPEAYISEKKAQEGRE